MINNVIKNGVYRTPVMIVYNNVNISDYLRIYITIMMCNSISSIIRATDHYGNKIYNKLNLINI